jgi:hypothetical protein
MPVDVDGIDGTFALELGFLLSSVKLDWISSNAVFRTATTCFTAGSAIAEEKFSKSGKMGKCRR